MLKEKLIGLKKELMKLIKVRFGGGYCGKVHTLCTYSKITTY